MPLEFSDQAALIDRLVTGFSKYQRRVVFLVGSAVTAPTGPARSGVAGVDGMIELVGRELNSVGTAGAVDGYQEAFRTLLSHRGQDVANRIVREAVLQAWQGKNPPEFLYQPRGIDDEDVVRECKRLEKQAAWHLSPAVECLGRILAGYPQHFGHTVLTTNFDPLLQVSIRNARGRSWRTALTTDGSLGQSEGEGCHVVHLHGYWHGTDTLHTSVQLARQRPRLGDSLAALCRGTSLVVVGYGGWDDIFMHTLAGMSEDPHSPLDVLWTFYEHDVDSTRDPAARVLRFLGNAVGGRVTCFRGIDCHEFLPELWKALVRIQPLLRSSRALAWNVPHRNPHFIGRETLLSELDHSLRSDHPALVHALHGLGGVGKTQLAVEYLYRHVDDYKVVWWVRAEAPATLREDYASLARELDLPEKEAEKEQVRIRAVHHWLAQNQGWILVFDNVDDSGDIERFLPNSFPVATGHVLLTTRHGDTWPKHFKPLRVPVLAREDAIRFLCQRCSETAEETEHKTEDAATLARELGDLPLALEQASAYMRTHRCSVAEYLVLFLRHRREILEPEGHSRTDPATSVNTTWQISFEALADSSPGGADLLKVCAFLASDDIPRDLLLKGSGTLSKSLRSAGENKVRWDRLIAQAERYSLIEKNNHTLSMHRLVQAITRDRCGDDGSKKKWAAIAIRLVNDGYSFDPAAAASWSRCTRLFPHALATLRHAKDMDVAESQRATLLTETGLYLHGRAEFIQALEHFQQALRIQDSPVGRPSTIAVHLNDVGQVLQELGDLESAIKCTDHALQLAERTQGPEHPNVAAYANNKGTILWAKGDFDKALKLVKRALNAAEKDGRDQASIAIYANNVAQILQDKGKIESAWQYTKRALEIDHCAPDSQRPATAILYSNAAQLLQEMGDLDQALQLAEQALDITKSICGDRHPHVAVHMNNIGQIRQDMKKFDEALRCSQASLDIAEAVYGRNHPAVATVANNIGRILRAKGEIKRAFEFTERALRIDATFYDSEHPASIRSITDIVEFLVNRRQGLPLWILNLSSHCREIFTYIRRKCYSARYNDRNIRQILKHRWNLEIAMTSERYAGTSHSGSSVDDGREKYPRFGESQQEISPYVEHRPKRAAKSLLEKHEIVSSDAVAGERKGSIRVSGATILSEGHIVTTAGADGDGRNGGVIEVGDESSMPMKGSAKRGPE